MMLNPSMCRRDSAPSAWLRAVVLPLALLAIDPLALCVRAEAVAVAPQARQEDLDFFEAQIRPILVKHCAECHSRAAGDPEGGLSFDGRSDFLAAEGVAVAGKPEDSLIVKAVRYDGDLQMPPDGKLPAEAIRKIEEWVGRGLPWPDDGKPVTGVEVFDLAKRRSEHWCWHPPRVAATPAVKNPAWCRSDIDRFVLARLEAVGLAQAPEAHGVTLVRRAAEILTGLPADPADVERIGADPDDKAYEQYIDRLLASPQYGERFARHWLDVARYGESRGHEFDFPIPNAWRYRDWVVKAFNDDLPYDQFVREQIAGDVIDPPRVDATTGANESVVGTGFWFLGEEVHSPVDIAQDEADRIDNRVDTFGKAFQGLALGCARCHDHKFDAISNEDYYAIAGMLMSSSYRQVPFETLPANRVVATRIEAAAAEASRILLPLVADTIASRGADLEAVLPTAAEIAAAVSDFEASEPRIAHETVIADYTRGLESTPLIADAWAWGMAAQPAGQPLLLPLVEGLPQEVRLVAESAARSEAVWSTTRTTGERDPGSPGQIDRAGRVLRTPKVQIREGVLWHRVRGNLQIFAVVDGHVLINGPLYGSTVMRVDTRGEWRWVRQDLRPGLVWNEGHLVHVEYAAITGEAAVAEAVASPEEPRRLDPLVALLVGRSETDRMPSGGEPRRMASAVEWLAEAERACRAGTLPESAHSAALASLVNRLLAGPHCEWQSAAAQRLVREATALSAVREQVLATAQLVSATAPAMLDGNGIDQYVLLKGSAARRGERSPRRFLEAIDGATQPEWPTHSSGRRELADRLLDPANPLTSRVIVNRIWHHLFGRGLAPTVDNFGKLGEPAADPQAGALLDTLAVRFRENGWSIKRLVKEIVTSSTWRMASSRDARAVEQDPLNLLLHHYPLRRLEGEAVRDKILAVSGRLNRAVGGPGVAVFLTEFHDGRGKPASGPLDGDGRRSIYTTIRRNFLPSFLLAFDMPVPFQAMGRRNVTNVPAQSLTLMNDAFVAEQAAAWARKTLVDSALPPEARIDRMYREAFARLPAADERTAAVDFLISQAQQHGVTFAAQPRHEATWTDFAHALINAKEFIFVP